GQTYQTGADPWQLFANWALLILPWVLVGRFAPLWLVWIALINLSIFLYFSVFRGIWGIFTSTDSQLLLAFAFNTMALAMWELAVRRYAWLAQRWAVRLLAIASGSTATVLMLQTVFDWHDRSGWSFVIYPLWVAGIYFIYRHKIQDLFMLAGASLSVIVIVTALLARALLVHGDAGGFLLIAMAVIAMSAAAAIWLRRVHAEQMS
ncbi:MAG: DUF2157 domain-containing protein, partial [Aestuariibacter sp.]|nr:DUF2157 domain-containing protein [Aestuariibacter sp.]